MLRRKKEIIFSVDHLWCLGGTFKVFSCQHQFAGCSMEYFCFYYKANTEIQPENWTASMYTVHLIIRFNVLKTMRAHVMSDHVIWHLHQSMLMCSWPTCSIATVLPFMAAPLKQIASLASSRLKRVFFFQLESGLTSTRLSPSCGVNVYAKNTWIYSGLLYSQWLASYVA